MNNPTRITFIAAQILLLIFSSKLTFCDISTAKPDSISTTHFDSLKNKLRKDTLTQQETTRKYYYYHDGVDFLLYSPFHITSKNFYGVDGISPTDVLSSNPLGTVAKFGLSSRLNRFLLYGNTAPVNKFYSGSLISETSISAGAIDGTDQIFSTEISDLYFINGGKVQYQYTPLQLAVPEVLLLWENGVFNENTLSLRFSRPMSRNLRLNVFSNFRSFKAQRYNQAADVTSIYRLFSDSSSIMSSGYNPDTKEQVVGAGLSWSSQKNLHLTMVAKYGDLSNELAVNTPAKNKSSLSYALMQQYPLQVSILSTYIISNRFSIDLDCKLLNESIVRTAGQKAENTVIPVRDDSKLNEIRAVVRPGIRMAKDDSIGILFDIQTDRYELFNDNEITMMQIQSSAFYANNFQLPTLSGTLLASAGAHSLKLEDSAALKPFFYAGAELSNENSRYRIYAEQNDVPFIVALDSLVYDQELIDTYIKAGCEFYKKWKYADLTLGYQFVHGLSDSSVIKSWPCNIPPYKQPGSAFIIGPSFGRWKGLGLRTNLMLSFNKPYLKASGALSYEIHPYSTREFIDLNLGFEYWSERDKIEFAGLTDWNRPIYDVSFQVAAHIRSFRLFYKISNLLNRNFSYVPGYYSPGITFRWGFNWYLQK